MVLQFGALGYAGGSALSQFVAPSTELCFNIAR